MRGGSGFTCLGGVGELAWMGSKWSVRILVDTPDMDPCIIRYTKSVMDMTNSWAYQGKCISEPTRSSINGFQLDMARRF